MSKTLKKKIIILIFIIIAIIFLAPYVHANKIISGRTPTKDLVGPNPSNNFNFFLSATPREHVITGGSSYFFTVKDVVWEHVTAGTIDLEADIITSGVPIGASLIFESANPSVATVDENGKVTRVSDGTALINAKATPIRGKYIKKQIPYPVLRTAGEANVFSSFVSGSLGRHIYDDIDSRISGLVASDATTKLFSTQDAIANTYVWNTDFWAYGVDLTSIVAYNSFTDCCAPGDFERRAGVLVSPRHIAYANHYTFPNGTTVRFIEQDGDVVTRTISNQAQVGSTDIQIALLDSDVTDEIGFAKVLPANYNTYLPSLLPFIFSSATSTVTIPSLNLLGGSYAEADSDKHGFLRELSYLNLGNGANYATPVIPDRLTFFGRDYYIGDSGNPSFLIINNELVLVNTTCCFGGSGPSMADNISAINSVMTSLGGGYTLTTVDLGDFIAY